MDYHGDEDSNLGDTNNQQGPLATLRSLRQFRSPPPSAAAPAASKMILEGGVTASSSSGSRSPTRASRQASSRLVIEQTGRIHQQRSSVPDESFFAIARDAYLPENDDNAFYAKGDGTGISVAFKGRSCGAGLEDGRPSGVAAGRSQLFTTGISGSCRRWSSVDLCQDMMMGTYRSFGEDIDAEIETCSSIDPPRDSGYFGTACSQLPLQPLDLENIGLNPVVVGRGGGGGNDLDRGHPRSPFSLAGIPRKLGSRLKVTAHERYRWSSRLEFVLVSLAFIHGIHQTVHFPLTAFRQGKGGFLMAYFALAALMALPLTYLQALLGQYWNQGALGLWRTLPICYGLGGLAMITTLTQTFVCGSNTAEALYHFGSALSGGGDGCHDSCDVGTSLAQPPPPQLRSSLLAMDHGQSWPETSHLSETSSFHGLQWQTGLATFSVWLIVFALTCVKPMVLSAKVVKITGVFQVAILFVISVKSLLENPNAVLDMVKGAQQIEGLAELYIWTAAGMAVIKTFSGPALAFVTLASMNRFNAPTLADLTTIYVVHFCIVILSCGYVCALGFPEDFGGHARGLVQLAARFATYGRLWSGAYLAMAALFELTTLIVLCEVFLVNIEDIGRAQLLRSYRWVSSFILCLFGFLISLLLLSSYGSHLLKLLPTAVIFCGPIGSLIFVLAIAFLYKFKSFDENVTSTQGSGLNLASRVWIWTLCPICLAFITILTIIKCSSIIEIATSSTKEPFFAKPIAAKVVSVIYLATVPLTGLWVVFRACRSGVPLSSLFKPDWQVIRTVTSYFMKAPTMRPFSPDDSAMTTSTAITSTSAAAVAVVTK